jgi:hypothetical protein
MKKYFVLIVLTLAITPLFSQNLPKLLNQANWQQNVNYDIKVELIDSSKSLIGFEKMTYTNNSPNTLDTIYIHLWPNAYRNRTTAFAKQQLENGNTEFHFAPESDRGYIDSFDFKINGEKVELILTSEVDIAILKLNEPLKSQQQIEITTPFYVKLPKVFSRLGVEDSIYCITQWYPKPAVYDVNGWNPIPYLSQGEFYSEFGKFDVSITLPKNFVLAATGEVQDPKEKIWWAEKSKDLNTPHFAQTENKTLRFIQDSIHDFAWFASPLFSCDQSEVMLSNGKRVETWIFGQPKNKKNKPSGILHANEGVQFYSEKVGNYPYSIAQVVITPLKAGAGMEYPTITNCADDSKTTIIHEIGHNWFYGILGTNERDYPWMDESINTYYENRHAVYNKNEIEIGKKANINSWIEGFNQSDFLYRYASRKNMDQAGNLVSTEYTDNNYGAIIYAKNPLGFRYLEHYLGSNKFDAMMQAYYEKWKFKHPLPNDFKQHAETFTKENLSWFFEGILGSTQKLDYQLISNKKGVLTVKNNGNLIAPLAISQKLSDSISTTVWVPGFEGTKTINIADLGFTNPSQIAKDFRLDAPSYSLDLYKQNNGKTKLKFQPLLNLENGESKQVFWAPLYAYNIYNKSMLGVAFYNSLMPQKKNEFVIAPLYSFGTNDLNGYVQYWHNWYTKGKIRNIQAGFKSARFASQGVYYNSGDPSLHSIFAPGGAGNYYGDISYEKFAPFITFNLQPKNRRSGINQSIQLRYVMVNEQAKDRGLFYQFGSDHFGTSEIKYSYQNSNALYPAFANIYLQNGLHRVSFNKLGVEINQGFTYAKGKKKKAEIRLFAGGFLFNKTALQNSPADQYSQRAYFQGGANTGVNDYLYDEAMIGRVSTYPYDPSYSVFEHQIIYKESGFRNFANVGSSNSFLSALNITIPAPIPVPIGVYGDFSYWQSPSGYTTVGGVAGTTTSFYPSKMNFTYNGGFYVTIIRNVFSIYVPVISSSDVSGYWEVNGHESIFSKTSFVLNLNNVNPINLIRNAKL